MHRRQPERADTYAPYVYIHILQAPYVVGREIVERVRAVCARLGGKVVAVEGLTDVPGIR